MTEEQKRLCDLIDGHCEAMKAQVVDPGVRTEWLAGSEWRPTATLALFDREGPTSAAWRRLAPAPKLIPLDQSDFLGVNRVTHLRAANCGGGISLVLYVDEHGVYIRNTTWVSYEAMKYWECSRDGGETWGPCSKPEVSK